MAYKRRNKRKKSFLSKRFLKLPIWLWIILICLVISGMGGKDSSSPEDTSSNSTTVATQLSTATDVIAENTPIVVAETPTLVATVLPTNTPNATSPPVNGPVESPSEIPATDPTKYVLKQGDKNDDVKALQRVLISLGYLSGSADGDFGPKTASALKAYQNAAGLPVTGECDYETYLSITSPNAPSAIVHVEDNEPVVTSNELSYVYNKNTKKFHYPSCSSAADIKPKNRGEFTGTRDELINRGYQPCKRCNP